MKIYEIKEVVEYMEHIYPSKPQSNYESIAKKYLDANVHELLKGYTSNQRDLATDRIPFRISNLTDSIQSRYDSNKYWLPLLRNNFPFFYTIQPGFKKNGHSQISQVQPYMPVEVCLGYFLGQDNSEVLEQVALLKEKAWIVRLEPHDGIINTPVDTVNLNKYIENTAEDYDNNNNSQAKRTLIKNLFSAKSIHDSLDQEHYLNQQYTIKPTSRCYMRGLNLQSAPAKVREAALGSCYKYDIRTSMYSHMLQHIVAHDPSWNVKGSYINEYCEHKARVRNMLADTCLTNTNSTREHKVKLVKDMLAAIGFGASLTNKYSDAMKKIYSADDRQNLIDNPWMKGLQAEINLYTSIMRLTYKSAKIQYREALQKNGRSSLSKWCTFDYQQTESTVMNFVINKIGRENVLLQVHDAIYVNHKVEQYVINSWARQISPLVHFEYEEIKDISYSRRLNKAGKVAEDIHKQRIIQEEITAFEAMLAQ